MPGDESAVTQPGTCPSYIRTLCEATFSFERWTFRRLGHSLGNYCLSVYVHVSCPRNTALYCPWARSLNNNVIFLHRLSHLLAFTFLLDTSISTCVQLDYNESSTTVVSFLQTQKCGCSSLWGGDLLMTYLTTSRGKRGRRNALEQWGMREELGAACYLHSLFLLKIIQGI